MTTTIPSSTLLTAGTGRDCPAGDAPPKRCTRAADSGDRGDVILSSGELRAIRANPERLFSEAVVRWHKRSDGHRVAEVKVVMETGPVHAVWKCIEERKPLRRLLSLFRRSPVRRAFATANALRGLGIESPRPLLFVERRRPARDRFYLLTEALPESRTLLAFFRSAWREMTAPNQEYWITSASQHLAGKLRRMHDAGFDHRDMKFPNLLVTGDAEPQIWLLDLDHVRKWPVLPRFRAVQNLSRLNASSLNVAEIGHTVRLRFLKMYLGEQFCEGWKTWWHVIAHRTRKKQLKNARNGRPLE